nr:MAG TPA: hypothetical protein [Caudoviricetes sp.]
MSIEKEVYGILDARIEILKGAVEWFEKFGNKRNAKDLMEHATKLAQLTELRTIKSDLAYGVRWPKEFT